MKVGLGFLAILHHVIMVFGSPTSSALEHAAVVLRGQEGAAAGDGEKVRCILT